MVRAPSLFAVAFVVRTLGGGACARDDRAGPEVLPAEEIFAEITIDFHRTGTSATLSLTTAMDMACAAVYGTTEELGDGIATDADMRGGAHREHSAVMLGLQPATEYFYRVQGLVPTGVCTRARS